MKKVKKLAMIEGIVAFGILALLVALVAFFFIYEVPAINAYQSPNPDADAGEQLGIGIGKAAIIVMMIISLICLAIPAILLIVSGAGQLAMMKKKGFTLAFAVVGMVGKVLAAVIVGFLVGLSTDRIVSTLSTVVYIMTEAIIVASFAWSIVALIWKKRYAPRLVAEEAPLAEAEAAYTE